MFGFLDFQMLVSLLMAQLAKIEQESRYMVEYGSKEIYIYVLKYILFQADDDDKLQDGKHGVSVYRAPQNVVHHHICIPLANTVYPTFRYTSFIDLSPSSC